MNLFTIRAISNAPLGQIILGSLPYVLLLIVGLAIVMIWPPIALWLPGTMLNLR
jgi:C4-dicarboxylate transporter DctM subunit